MKFSGGALALSGADGICWSPEEQVDKESLERLLQSLKKAQKKLRPYFGKSGTDCYRVFSGVIDNNALRIDLYGEEPHISLSQAKGIPELAFDDEEIRRLAGALYTTPEKVVLKNREKLEGHRQYSALGQSERMKEVRENSLTFLVNLHDYIDTGLFTDHRKTRQMVREECFGKKVLNLFAYTGSFSVYAAAGGAETVTSVDLSATYLDWAKKNFQANDFLPGMFEFVRSDVVPFLKEAAEQGRKWDLIILDPPTFSNSRKMEGVWDIQKHHAAMIRLCASLLTKEGLILFSTNSRRFALDRQGLSAFRIEEISALTRDEDYSPRDGHRCWRLTPHKPGQARSSGRSQSRGRSRAPSRKNSPSSGSQRNRKSR